MERECGCGTPEFYESENELDNVFFKALSEGRPKGMVD